MVQRVKYVAKRKSRPFAFRYRSPPGKVELELLKACRFKRRYSESRQQELERLMCTVAECDVEISQQAAGWLNAAIDLYNQGCDLPEPDKFKWLPASLQFVLGAFTVKRFMKMEFVESKRERRLMKAR
jgi:hypothetical protein